MATGRRLHGTLATYARVSGNGIARPSARPSAIQRSTLPSPALYAATASASSPSKRSMSQRRWYEP